LRRHSSRCGPGDCEHPIAVANVSKGLKLGWGAVETFSPESKMAARNGGTTDEFRRVMASEMDMPPADWPCERKNWSRMMTCVFRGWNTYHECYLTFVSPELGDIVLHPSERELLIEEAKIVACGGKIRCCWETKHVRSVVEGDKDDVLILRKRSTIVHWNRRRAQCKPSA